MKIVHHSKVELIDWMGDDLRTVNAARVSFSKESEWKEDGEDAVLNDKDVKLISYLGKHGHWTPFAHNFVAFRISAPVFVARQLVKHQVGLVWNEVSRRYVDDEPEFYIPKEWRGRPKNSKQGSDGILKDEQPGLHLSMAATASSKCSLMAYNDLLEAGVAPEQARMVLPQNTMTEWYWSGSLMAFARVCKQRLDPHAQAETREVAEGIDKECADLFPVSWSALKGE
jgi:thymidylate synthase (FAD)